MKFEWRQCKATSAIHLKKKVLRIFVLDQFLSENCFCKNTFQKLISEQICLKL